MSELLGVFRQHLVWSLTLWLMVFTVFAVIFAGGNLLAFTTGLLRLLLSLVTSPFVFLRRATAGVLGFTSEEEEAYRKGDQYLLSKAMMVVQALIIVAAIGALAAAVIATWSALVPRIEIRREAREHRPRVEEQRLQAAKAAERVQTLDTAWAAKEAGVVQRFRDARQTTINAATRDMGHIATTITTYGNEQLKQLFARLTERAVANEFSSRDGAEAAKAQMDRDVSNYWYWLEDWSRNSLARWNELWLGKRFAQIELADIPLARLREAEQPDYTAAVANSASQAETLQQMIRTQEHLDEAASLKWKRALLAAVGSFVTILLFLWIAGLVVEGGWLAIRVAGDVRRLRESADAHTKPLLEATAHEVRLPIRDSAAPQVPHPQRV